MKKAALAFILFALALAGCATDEAAKNPQVVSLKTDYQAQLEVAAAELRAQRDDRARMLQACNSGARPTTDVQFALEAMSRQSCYFMAAGLSGQAQGLALPAPPPPVLRPDAWDRALAVTDRVLGFGLQALGLKFVRDVGIVQSNNTREMTVAGYQTFGTMGGHIRDAGTAGYPYIQAPGAVTTTTNTLSGTGVLGSGTYSPTTRTCTSGAISPPPIAGGATPLTFYTQASC